MQLWGGTCNQVAFARAVPSTTACSPTGRVVCIYQRARPLLLHPDPLSVFRPVFGLAEKMEDLGMYRLIPPNMPVIVVLFIYTLSFLCPPRQKMIENDELSNTF